MKNGLLIYQSNKDNIFNIGDYIQSLAAAQFYNNVIDVFVNRELLDEYESEDIRLIMNGWFMHKPEHWPPSSRIHPLFVSFHINSLVKEEMLGEKSISYFRKYEPIGCRDMDTVLLLQSKGIDSFFTGCLTLTLAKCYKNKSSKREGIYFVDPYYETSKNLFSILEMAILLFKKYFVVSIISQKARGNKSIKNLLRTAFFYTTYSKIFTDDVLMDSQYIKHEIPDNFPSEDTKYDYAKSLLKRYSEAVYIVTSKIHCALPCLSLETPVLYVDNINQNEASYCRLNGIRQLFNVVSYNNGVLKVDFTTDKISKKTNFRNKEDYKVFMVKLIEVCEQFIKTC